ncbi:hypothetical protein ACWDC2_35805, partial [Streptomyces olivaceus]
LCDLLVPKGHRFAGRAAVRRAELGGERWICRHPGPELSTPSTGDLRQLSLSAGSAWEGGAAGIADA